MINRRRPPNNLRIVTRFCVGLQIQVGIKCLQVVSGNLRLNRRRPAKTCTLSVIVSNESYGAIVVNRRTYKGASDRIAKSLRRSCCRRLWQARKPLIKRKDARRCRLQSPPMQSAAIGGSSHDFSTKPGQNPFKNLRQCD